MVAPAPSVPPSVAAIWSRWSTWDATASGLGRALQQAGDNPTGPVEWDRGEDVPTEPRPDADDPVTLALEHLESAGLTEQAAADLGALARMTSGRYR